MVVLVLLYSHFILGFVQAVGQSGGCWLVDHTQHVQTGDLTGIFGSLEVTERPSNILSTVQEKLQKRPNSHDQR